MTQLTTFFAELSSLEKLAWIGVCLLFSWVLEFGVPLFSLSYKKWRHAGINFVFLATSLLVNVLFGILTVGLIGYFQVHQWGLLFVLGIPAWAKLLFSLLFLDFVAQYVVHYLLHKVSFMWRFHMIHHSDTHVDATTGTRHHPGDYVFRELFGLIAVLILGAPLGFYIFYKIVTILFTYLTHANIAVPNWLDKPLSWVFVTPNMHKFHHHFERPWTDTNYGNIFSFWDRLFGTLVTDDPKKVIYGLDVVDNDRDEDLAYQFGLPFDKGIKTDY